MKSLKFLLVSAVFMLLGSNAIAQRYDARTDQIALSGYDVVAYFTLEDAVEGSAVFTTEASGKTWHFSSAANRDLFVAAPEKYLPQYDGHCAFAASQGAVAPIDPLAWTVFEDKLYLNFNIPTRDRWRGNRDNLIEAADRLWPDVRPQG